jgi:hypothetical protein
MKKKWDTVIPADFKRLFVKWEIYRVIQEESALLWEMIV